MDQLQKYKTEMNLNDWAYYSLLQQFAQALYPDSQVGEDLLVWDLLTRSGFKSRIAYANNNVSLLVPSNIRFYSKNFIEVGWIKLLLDARYRIKYFYL